MQISYFELTTGKRSSISEWLVTMKVAYFTGPDYIVLWNRLFRILTKSMDVNFEYVPIDIYKANMTDILINLKSGHYAAFGSRLSVNSFRAEFANYRFSKYYNKRWLN